jgi:hypothetical protein
MGSLTFKIYQGDITAVQVEAIVNGTNTDLDLSLGKNCFYIQQLPAGSMGVVPTGHRPIKSRHFYQAKDKMLCDMICQ